MRCVREDVPLGCDPQCSAVGLLAAAQCFSRSTAVTLDTRQGATLGGSCQARGGGACAPGRARADRRQPAAGCAHLGGRAQPRSIDLPSGRSGRSPRPRPPPPRARARRAAAAAGAARLGLPLERRTRLSPVAWGPLPNLGSCQAQLKELSCVAGDHSRLSGERGESPLGGLRHLVEKTMESVEESDNAAAAAATAAARALPGTAAAAPAAAAAAPVAAGHAAGSNGSAAAAQSAAPRVAPELQHCTSVLPSALMCTGAASM